MTTTQEAAGASQLLKGIGKIDGDGFKDIENRSWPTGYRGQFLIHAAKGMTRAEYEDGADLAAQLGITIPSFDSLERGGIVGRATIVGCVEDSPSPWFFGKYGFALKDAAALPFQAVRGRLGFFDPTQEQDGPHG